MIQEFFYKYLGRELSVSLFFLSLIILGTAALLRAISRDWK